MTGNQAWATIGALVAIHELTAPQGQLLSHSCDRARAKQRILTDTLIIATALHLLRWCPPHLDIYAGFGYPLLTRIKGRPA